MTEEECLQEAADAEALAQLLAYRPDRERLMRSAREWRRLAARMKERSGEAPRPSTDKEDRPRA